MLAFVIALHALLLLAALWPRFQPPPASPPVPVSLGAEDNRGITMPDKGVGLCHKPYVGVGIVTSIVEEVVELAEGGPAALAGVKVGDFVVERGDTYGRDRTKPGTIVRLTVERDGRRLSFVTRSARICSKEKP